MPGLCKKFLYRGHLVDKCIVHYQKLRWECPSTQALNKHMKKFAKYFDVCSTKLMMGPEAEIAPTMLHFDRVEYRDYDIRRFPPR